MEYNKDFKPRRKRIGEDRGNRVTSSNSFNRENHEGHSQEHHNFGEGRRSFRSSDDHREHRYNGGRNSFGDSERRPSYNGGERRKFNGEKRRFNGERREFNGERREFNGERKQYGGQERRPFNHDGHRNEGERRSFGGNRDTRPRTGNPRDGRSQRTGIRKNFRKEDNSGIDKMIDRRSQMLIDEISSSETVGAIPTKNVIRLNKFIANSGICSRREADDYILAGVVTVNGEVVTELGSKVNVLEDDVRFNGERLKGEEKVYIVMNKPKGFVTTASDPHADKTVTDLLKGCPARVFPVGRLDKNTTGVLMFTNDGEMAEKLTHPSYDKKKIYQVNLDSDLKQEDYDKILAGITLTDGEISADDLEYIDENDHRKIGIEIHSGKNHIVRRIFESLGYSVKALDRVYFAGLTKKGLKKGEWRYLTLGETNILKMGSYK